MAVARGMDRRVTTTAAVGSAGHGAAVAALAAAAVVLGGCGIVPGVDNDDLPVGTPFEGDTTAECFPPGGDPEEAIWRTGQIEFVPIFPCPAPASSSSPISARKASSQPSPPRPFWAM